MSIIVVVLLLAVFLVWLWLVCRCKNKKRQILDIQEPRRPANSSLCMFPCASRPGRSGLEHPMAQEQLPVCHSDSEVNIPCVPVVNGAGYMVGGKLCCRGVVRQS
jgi:hypothetical protein